MKLNLGQYSEARFGQDFNLRFSRNGDEVSVEPVEANNNIGARPKTSNPNLNR